MDTRREEEQKISINGSVSMFNDSILPFDCIFAYEEVISKF